MQSLLSELCWNILTLFECHDISFLPPSFLCLLVSPCFVIKRLLFPLKIMLRGHCWEISVKQHMQKHMHCLVSQKEQCWVFVARSQGSFPKRLKADSSGTDFHCTVQSCELKNLSYTSTYLIRMVSLSSFSQMLQWKIDKKKPVMQHLGLVHIQSSWSSSTQDMSRLGLGCKFWWDGLVGCIFTTETGKTNHLWLYSKSEDITWFSTITLDNKAMFLSSFRLWSWTGVCSC